jgi:hypothetical protein
MTNTRLHGSLNFQDGCNLAFEYPSLGPCYRSLRFIRTAMIPIDMLRVGFEHGPEFVQTCELLLRDAGSIRQDGKLIVLDLKDPIATDRFPGALVAQIQFGIRETLNGKFEKMEFWSEFELPAPPRNPR